MCNIMQYLLILLMEEFLRHLIGSSSHYLQGFLTSQVVQDFFHQQYHLDNSKSGGIFVQRHPASQLFEAFWNGSFRTGNLPPFLAPPLLYRINAGETQDSKEFLEVPGGWKGSIYQEQRWGHNSKIENMRYVRFPLLMRLWVSESRITPEWNLLIFQWRNC